MKKLFVMLILGLMPVLLMAHGHGDRNHHNRHYVGAASLQITFNPAFQYMVFIDGIRYHACDGLIELRHLTPGKHFVEISQRSRNGRYNRVSLVYEGFIRVRPGVRYKARIFRDGYFSIIDHIPYCQRRNTPINYRGYNKARRY